MSLVVLFLLTTLACGKASAWKAGDIGSIPGCHTSDFKTGTLAVTLQGAGHHSVSAGSGWSSVQYTETG